MCILIANTSTYKNDLHEHCCILWTQIINQTIQTVCLSFCVCACMRATAPEGERRRKVGSVGIKTEEKRKEIERRSFAQPSITFLGFKFIWLLFLFFWNTQHTGEELGDGEKDRGRKQHEEREGEGKGGGEQYTAGENNLGEKGVVRKEKDTRNR